MYGAGFRWAGSNCGNSMGDRMFYHTPPLRSARTAVTSRCYRVTSASAPLPAAGTRQFLPGCQPSAPGRNTVMPQPKPKTAGIEIGPAPYNCRQTLRTAHDPTLSFRIVRRDPDGCLLRPGAAQFLVCPGVRRGVRSRLHLRLSARGVAFRTGGGGMVGDRFAPLVVATEAG